MSGNCCGAPNGNAMCNNFGGGPQNAFQAGFKQGMMAAKMKKLMRKMHRLMAQMSQMGGAGGCGGPGFGGPNFGGGCFGGGFGNPGSRPVADSGSWLFAFSWLWTGVPGRGEKI